ncbi:hypothetical protein [Kurthia massiliensis]|uniref:hypothetical protein n=1 Tax=Kurthia massiliensis TaxID=1033739 RepID=UPI0002882B54|nr:hypothetical protein [Kurthia massiliensis]
MFWIAIVVIVAITAAASLAERMIKSREKTKKLEIEMMREQIKLEQLKYDNYKMETEKMRLELQRDIQQAPTKEQLLNVDLQKDAFSSPSKMGKE